MNPIKTIALVSIAGGGMVACAALAYKVSWIFVLGVPGAAITSMAAAMAFDREKR